MEAERQKEMVDAALCSSVGVIQSFNRAGVKTIGRQECLGCGCFKDVLLHLISQEDNLCFLRRGIIAIFTIGDAILQY